MSDFGKIWTELSAIDISEYVQKKQGLTYLPWASAWTLMMQYAPHAQYTFGPERTWPDGSMEVTCTVHVGDYARTMQLPVMDHRNRAIKNPDAMAINTARQRCMVKCLALFGLGMPLYRGEDVDAPVAASQPAVETLTPEQCAAISDAARASETPVERITRAFKVERLHQIPASNFEGIMKRLAK